MSNLVYLVISILLTSVVTAKSIIPEVQDTCGQNRTVLGNWFIVHGGPDLLEDPIPYYVAPVEEDPYQNPDYPPEDPNPAGVCAMKWSENLDTLTGHKKYFLKNFTNIEESEAEGFTVTHVGHCGACSTLQDLGVYIRQNLTDSTRMCGFLGTVSHALMRDCLMSLGFSLPCITIWEWNILNTKAQCFQVCLLSYITGEPNNKPDGSLNDCLQCDEDKSGPNFKFFSGRTRRNSGIPSAIQRPPDQVYDMEHCYWYGDLL